MGLDETIIEAAVPLWRGAHRHARCRYKHLRPSDKGRNQPLADTVDELLAMHGIPASMAFSDLELYGKYESAIRLKAQEGM